MQISRKEARQFLLSHHGLFPPRYQHGEKGILGYIHHVGCIQFDPINIVGRNPDLVLQSRVKDYKPLYLDRLLYRSRTLIDGWDKMASILITADWPNFHRRRETIKHFNKERRPPQEVLEKVIVQLKKYGPLSSLDFDMNEKVDWHWGPTRVARAALEYLYAEGRIGIDHRINSRRFFDLIENLLPDDLLSESDPFESIEDYHDWHFHRRVGSMGLAESRFGEYKGILGAKSKERTETLARLTENEKVIPITIDEFPNRKFYIRNEDLETLNRIKLQEKHPEKAAILAPLDNILWNRGLINDLFGFEYVWEVYKPKKQRRYGYYVLPVIFGDCFIARFEPGYNKESRAFTIKGWWWENGFLPDSRTENALICCFKDFLTYLDATEVMLDERLKLNHTLDWIAAVKS